MRVAICSVGAELLSGEIVDTNAAWMASRVRETGGAVTAVLVTGDDRAEIVGALEWLAERADVVLVGGGLGPTSDDLTRDAVADFAAVELERREELVAHLMAVYARLDRPIPPGALTQADIPVGASVHQPLGSAAGFAVDASRDGRTVRVHVLPGVPWEYRGIADRDVLPDLVRRSAGIARVTRALHVAGAGESWIGDVLGDLTDRLESDPDIELGYRAMSDEVQVRITACAPTPAAARARAAAVLDEAAELLGEAVTSIDGRRLEDVVAGVLRSHGLTVATAETLTAGRVGAVLSSVAGATDYLRGGIHVHDAFTAASELGLDREPLARHGLVSRDAATLLAGAVRERFDADLGLAVVGAAPGDSVSDRQPPGTVIWAIAGPADTEVAVEQTYITGDREIVQTRAAAFALESLRRQASH